MGSCSHIFEKRFLSNRIPSPRRKKVEREYGASVVLTAGNMLGKIRVAIKIKKRATWTARTDLAAGMRSISKFHKMPNIYSLESI